MATKYSNGEEFVSALVTEHCPQPVISSSLSLNTYYKRANSIFNQALNNVKQSNHAKAYIELMKYSQLILKLSSHSQYNLKEYEKDKKLNKRRLNNAILKLEEIKPQLIKAYNDKLALINAEKKKKEEEQRKQQESLPPPPTEESKLNESQELPPISNNTDTEIASYPSLDNNAAQPQEDNPWTEKSESYPSLTTTKHNDDQKDPSDQDYPTLPSKPTPSKTKLYTLSPKLNTKTTSSPQVPVPKQAETPPLPPEPSIPSSPPLQPQYVQTVSVPPQLQYTQPVPPPKQPSVHVPYQPQPQQYIHGHQHSYYSQPLPVQHPPIVPTAGILCSSAKSRLCISTTICTAFSSSISFIDTNTCTNIKYTQCWC